MSTYKKPKFSDLKHRANLYTTSESSDSEGGVTESESTVKENVWCQIIPMDGTRALEYSQIYHAKPFVIIMRKRSDVTINESTYMVYDSRTFIFRSVINEYEADWYLKILATEKA